MAPASKINLADKVDDGEMDLSMCDLQEVPVKEITAYRKVWNLDLSNNHLTQITKQFTTLTNLTKLDLSKNKLRKLPDNFGDLTRLKHLDLYKNELQHLPLSFGQLKNLKWLDLKDNPLVAAIQEAAGDCLDTVQCQVCASNIVFFFQKLREKVEEERALRDKETQKEKEKQNEINAQKSKTQVKEKKKKKDMKQTASQTSVKSEMSVDASTMSYEKLLIQRPVTRKRSLLSILFLSFLLFAGILFILTACGFDKTVMIEDIITKTWSDVMIRSPPVVRNAGNAFAEGFSLVHRKVGQVLIRSQNKSYIEYFNDKVKQMYNTLIY